MHSVVGWRDFSAPPLGGLGIERKTIYKKHNNNTDEIRLEGDDVTNIKCALVKRK